MKPSRAIPGFLGRLGRRPTPAPPRGPPAPPATPSRLAEALERERATRDARAFQTALADSLIAQLGIVSPLTADEVHVHVARILAGSASVTFQDEIEQDLRRRQVSLAGTWPNRHQLAACLCSPMMSVLVRRRLVAQVEAATVDPSVDTEAMDVDLE